MPETILPRAAKHLARLRDAGADAKKLLPALEKIRNDRSLSDAERRAIYRLVALESALWYRELITGRRVDREALHKKAESQLAKKKR